MTQIENKKDLVSYFFKGSKSKSNFKIGTEHEKFLFDLKNKNPIPYDGDISIVKIFSELIKNNWVPIKEGKNILGLVKDKKILLWSQVYNLNYQETLLKIFIKPVMKSIRI